MPLGNTFGYTSERLWRRLGWMGSARLVLAIGACTTIGYIAAKLAGFPLCPGWQGVFVQQPRDVAGWGLAAAVAAMVIGLAVSLLIAPPADMRMPAAMAATTLLGFSIRGGTMGSVMQAAGGREVFWLLAGELAVLTVPLMLILIVWRGMRSPENRAPGAAGTTGLASGAVQLLATAAMMWVLGRNYQKLQAVMAVLLAAGFGTWTAHMVTGHIWRWAWIMPLVVGIAGYAVNGIWAEGVETATIAYGTQGFAMALPVDYAAVGMLGAVLGVLVAHGEEDDLEETPAAGESPSTAG